MLSLICSGYSVGGNVQVVDDGRGAIIPIELESQGEVFGVWGGNGGGVAVSPSTDIPWEISRIDTAMGYHRPQSRSKNI